MADEKYKLPKKEKRTLSKYEPNESRRSGLSPEPGEMDLDDWKYLMGWGKLRTLEAIESMYLLLHPEPAPARA